MIYTPIQVKCIKGLESINPEEFLNDGMNYQVYRAKQNVIKHYQAMDDMAALNQLLQVLDQEALATSKSPTLFESPMGYELVNRNGRGDVYLLYEFRMTVRKFIDSRFKLMEATLLGTQEQANEDQELYNELIGENDDEEVMQKIDQERQQELYQEMQLKFAVPETELREMLVSTVILLYELEEKGIEISSITHSNCLLEGGQLRFMDLVNRSSDFELTLEEYLEIDSDIKITPSFVSPSPVKRLGILMLSLMALLNLGPEQESDFSKFLDSATSYSPAIRRLVAFMILEDVRFFRGLLESAEFVSYGSQAKQSLLESIRFEFHVKPTMASRLAVQRLEERRVFEQVADFWQSTKKQQTMDYKPVSKNKSNKQVSLEVCSVIRCKTIVLDLDSISFESESSKMTKGIVASTQAGEVLLFDTRSLVSCVKCSSRQLYQVRRVRPKFICSAGEDGALYVLSRDDNYSTSTKKQAHLAAVWALSSIQNDMGNFLLTGDRNGKIIVFAIDREFEIIKQLDSHDDRVSSIVFRSRYQFLTGSFDQKIKLWDLRNLDTAKALITGNRAEITTLHIRGSLLLSFSNSLDRHLRAWEWKNEIFTFIYQLSLEDKVRRATTLTESKLLLASSKSLLVYDVEGRKVVKAEKMHLNEITCVNLVETTLVASSSFDGTIKCANIVWN